MSNIRVAVLCSGFMYNTLYYIDNILNYLIKHNSNIHFDIFLVSSIENYKRLDGGVKIRCDFDSDQQQYIYNSWKPYLKSLLLTENSTEYQTELELLYKSYDNIIKNNYKPRYKPEYVDQPFRASCIDQYLRLKYAWKLMEQYETNNSFEYDIVIRIRPDLTISEPFDLNPYINDHINIPCKSHYYHHYHDKNYLKEFFFFGKRELMKIICHNWVDSYGKYLDPLFEVDGPADYTLAPEYQFYLFIKHNILSICFIPFSCEYERYFIFDKLYLIKNINIHSELVDEHNPLLSISLPESLVSGKYFAYCLIPVPELSNINPDINYPNVILFNS